MAPGPRPLAPPEGVAPPPAGNPQGEGHLGEVEQGAVQGQHVEVEEGGEGVEAWPGAPPALTCHPVKLDLLEGDSSILRNYGLLVT